MTCRDCLHYLSSEDAGQRAVLPGYGYCKQPKDAGLRARFFNAAGQCWLVPVCFVARGKNEQ